MLKDIGHFNTAKIGDLILWEQILPYAAPLVSQASCPETEIDFGQAEVQASFIDFYHCTSLTSRVNRWAMRLAVALPARLKHRTT